MVARARDALQSWGVSPRNGAKCTRPRSDRPPCLSNRAIARPALPPSRPTRRRSRPLARNRRFIAAAA